MGIAHTNFTARDLQSLGYKKVEILPYTLWEQLYEPSPDKEILQLFRGGPKPPVPRSGANKAGFVRS
jgi:hypothetical protein